ncbi:hypothetical protein KKG83_07440 [Candidatus Micrarchaeota archaeon]|nr:hypothetical protein [Candidatus Micrarchaeota archaeon]MBU2477273.1 hypothetical protein [Candidatus Micrarchaeota archaeon]
MKIKLVLFLLLLLASFCFALSYEELPKGIEIKGIVTIKGDIIGNAQTVEHTTFKFFEEGAFEKANYVSLLDKEGNPITSYEFPSDVKDVGKEFGEIEFFPFQIIVPFEEEVDAIAFADSERNLKWLIQRSANEPEIEITFPLDGEAWNSVEEIKWEISDADEEDWLLVDVYYADNSGLGWALIKREAEGNELILSKAIQATRIMVIVSDGFNVGGDVSQSSSAGKLDDKIEYDLMELVSVTDENTMLENDLNYHSKPYMPSDENKTPPTPPKPPEENDWIYFLAGIILVVIIALAYTKIKAKKK